MYANNIVPRLVWNCLINNIIHIYCVFLFVAIFFPAEFQEKGETFAGLQGKHAAAKFDEFCLEHDMSMTELRGALKVVLSKEKQSHHSQQHEAPLLELLRSTYASRKQ